MHLPEVYGEFSLRNISFLTLRAGDRVVSAMVGVTFYNVLHQKLQPAEVVVANLTGVVLNPYRRWSNKVKVEVAHVLVKFKAGRNDICAFFACKDSSLDWTYIRPVS